IVYIPYTLQYYYNYYYYYYYYYAITNIIISHFQISFHRMALDPIIILLRQGIHFQFNQKDISIMFLTWLWSAFILSSVYQDILFATLTNPDILPAPDNIDELYSRRNEFSWYLLLSDEFITEVCD